MALYKVVGTSPKGKKGWYSYEDTREEAEQYIEKLRENPNSEGYVFEIRECSDEDQKKYQEEGYLKQKPYYYVDTFVKDELKSIVENLHKELCDCFVGSDCNVFWKSNTNENKVFSYLGIGFSISNGIYIMTCKLSERDESLKNELGWYRLLTKQVEFQDLNEVKNFLADAKFVDKLLKIFTQLIVDAVFDFGKDVYYSEKHSRYNNYTLKKEDFLEKYIGLLEDIKEEISASWNDNDSYVFESVKRECVLYDVGGDDILISMRFVSGNHNWVKKSSLAYIVLFMDFPTGHITNTYKMNIESLLPWLNSEYCIMSLWTLVEKMVEEFGND